MALSETHLRADKPSILPEVEGYDFIASERSGLDKGGGGMVMYYKKSLTTHPWVPDVEDRFNDIQKERQWLLIEAGTAKVAFLHLYIACKGKDNSYQEWNRHIYDLVGPEIVRIRKQGFSVVSMGDYNSKVGRIDGLEFNNPILNENEASFTRFVGDHGLVIVNTLPFATKKFTRFPYRGDERSKSVLDYALVDSNFVSSISDFDVVEPPRFDFESDHALIECKISVAPFTSLNAGSCLDFGSSYRFNSDTCFKGYKSKLDELIRAVPIQQFAGSSTSIMLDHLSSSVTAAATACFGRATKRRKKGRILPAALVKIIKRKKDVTRAINMSSDPGCMEDGLDELRAELVGLKRAIRDSIADHQIRQRNKVKNTLLFRDPSRKKFWRHIRNKTQPTGVITALRRGEQMVFAQPDIEEVVVSHFEKAFCGQRTPVFNREDEGYSELSEEELSSVLDPDPSLENISENEFESRVCKPISVSELGSILNKLPTEKAAGVDGVSNELLSNSGFAFRT